jgi:hypothetical protein
MAVTGTRDTLHRAVCVEVQVPVLWQATSLSHIDSGDLNG